MILIDSSAWIHFFNQTDMATARLIQELIRQDLVVTCGLVVTEVSSGSKRPDDQRLLRDQFEILPWLGLEEEDYYAAGSLRARLRVKGIRVKTVDSLIARLAIRGKASLLHFDSDFNRIARYFPLQIQSGSLGHPLEIRNRPR